MVGDALTITLPPVAEALLWAIALLLGVIAAGLAMLNYYVRQELLRQPEPDSEPPERSSPFAPAPMGFDVDDPRDEDGLTPLDQVIPGHKGKEETEVMWPKEPEWSEEQRG